MNKLDELKVYLSSQDHIEFLFITETHLSKDILDAELQISGYSFIRRDRNYDIKDESSDTISLGGGSIIYYKNYINISVFECFDKAPDSIAISVLTSGGKICLACIYRSPSLSSKQNDNLLQCMDKICHEDNEFETVMIGDFNLPNVSWENGMVKAPIGTNNKVLTNQEKYVNLFNDKGMSWYFTDAITRRRIVNDTLQESLLDQVLFSNDALVSDVQLLAPLGKSDHISFVTELSVNLVNAEKDCEEIQYRNSWNKVKASDLCNYSKENIDWNYSCSDLSIEEMWDELLGKLNLVESVVPKIPLTGGSRPVKLPWSTSSLKRMRKNKEKAWKQFDMAPTHEQLDYALTKQRLYEEEEFRLKLGYERKITSILKISCKPFYSYLRNKRKLKTSVPFLSRGDGTRTQSASESAEVQANAFSSVFVNEPLGPLPKLQECNSESSQAVLDEIFFSPDDVKRELISLNVFKSFGPDNIHPKLLKSLASDNSFVEAVTQLFIKCSEAGTMPSIWKEASVIALFKSGKKTDPLNYRPVSLTCIICKVYEQLIRTQIVGFLEDKITDYQHGFVNGKSCLSNLLETFDSIFNILEEGAPVDILYFDFSKAFDRVPHYRLMSKLENIGIRGQVLDIIRDFLTNRTLKVSVNGECSEIKRVLSGVPQGSVLGPLLFVLFINDLPDNIKSNIKLFADDLKLIGNANCHEDILEDLKELEYWEQLWLLKFNVDKCKVVHVKHNDNPHHDYFLDGLKLKESEQERDLGVLTSDTLLWNDQIKSCIAKANKMISWIVRNLVLRERNVMLSVYKMLIRPHLEYCVQLWNPVPEHGSWSLILELEGVQRRFTRLIDEIGTLPYSERLASLNLTTLAERRIRGDLIEVFKALNGFSSLGSIFNISRSGLKLISGEVKRTSSAKVKTLHKHFLTERVVMIWNMLPFEVKSSLTVKDFKINLEHFKKTNMENVGRESNAYFWKVSETVLSKIEGKSYLDNKTRHNEYLSTNPFAARKLFINMRGYNSTMGC